MSGSCRTAREWQRRLRGVQARFRDGDVFRLALDADEPEAFREGSAARGARSAERVEDQAVRRRHEPDEPAHQIERLDAWMPNPAELATANAAFVCL